MPTVHRIESFRFFFFSNEGNEPMHIHVESGGRYAKFWLNPVQVAKSVGYNARELNKLRKMILENLAFFEEQWYGFFGRKNG